MVKNQPQKTCIIVLGMHRSGTSALTRLMNICGASLPKTLLKTSKGNKTGHWESQKIVNLHDQLLSKVGSSWNDWSKLDLATISKSIETDYIDDLASLLSSEYGEPSLIVLKDPRVCRFLPLTVKALTAAGYNSKIIHIIRNPIEVSHSLMARNDLPEENGHLLWLRHNLDAEKYSRGIAYTSLTYDSLLDNWKKCLDNIQTTLKLFDQDKLTNIAPQVNKFLSPNHRHHTQTLEDTLIDQSLRSWIGLTFETFVNTQGGVLSEESQSHLDAVDMEFTAATPFMTKMLATIQAQSKLIETSSSEPNKTIITELQNKLKELEAGLATELEQKNKIITEKREFENQNALSNEKVATLYRQLNDEISRNRDTLTSHQKRETEILEGLTWERNQREHVQQALEASQKRETEVLERLTSEHTQREHVQQALEASQKRETEILEALTSERNQREHVQQALEASQNNLLNLKNKADEIRNVFTSEKTKDKNTISKLETKVKLTKKSLKDATQNNVKQQEKLTQAEGEISQLQGTLKSRSEEFSTLKKELTEIQTSHKLNLNIKTQLEQGLEDQELQITELKLQFNKNIEQLSADLKKETEKLNTLNTKLDQQVAATEFKKNQIEAIYASNSWKLGAPLRALKRAWRNKTRLLVALLAGGSARALMKNSDDFQLAAEQSRSSAILKSRIALQNDRQNMPNAPWLKGYVNRGIFVEDEELPNVTISVVLYNSERWLWNFFMSVESLQYPTAKISIHFIDNGSSDKTVEAVRTFIEKNKYRYGKLEITERPNLGYGMGNDYAIREAETDFVLVTNADIEFYPDCLRNLVSVAISDDENVACWETRQTPYEHPKYYDPVTLESNWSAHASVLLRRSAYLEVGGYDPNIFMYGEDVELSYRFRAKGWKLRYVPIATIYHHVELGNSDVRPHQLSGSSAANILLRYRYGTYRDILAGEAFFYAVRRNETDPLRAEAWEQVEKILRKNRWYFFKSRIKTNEKVHFPFNEFDYDITRPGDAVIRKPFKPLEAQNLPLVSIITRTHGQADIHLRNVIANVLTQTYPNIEHIIVEDKTDFAKDYVTKMSDIYGDRIQYLKSPGQGRSECGNHGARHAKGQYLCWLDNDDLLFADHIETLIRAFDDDASAVCSYALAWDAFVNEADGEPYADKFELPLSHKQDYDKTRFNTENFIPIQAIVFRKSLFNQHGGFNADFSQLEDWNLWARYSEAGNFIYTPKVTSVYFTPSDPKKRNERHLALHAAYDDVKRANISDMLEIRQSLSTQVAGKALCRF